MKVMFDSGATRSFIKKTALKRTKHLPIKFNQQHYLMADGYTKFEVVGLVKIFIELNQMRTSIVVGVVNKLSADCILGMDYINKYKVNLNNKEKQVQIYASNDKTIIPMADSTYISPVFDVKTKKKMDEAQVQTKAQVRRISSTHSDTSIKETSSLDDQPLQEEGYEFDVIAIAEAQKADKLYQEKILELKKGLTKCSYMLNDGILYKLFNRDAFTRKLIYVPSTILQQLLKAYHDAPGAGRFGFRRIYFKLKGKYWWPYMKTTIKNYIQSCLKAQKFNIDRKFSGGSNYMGKHATTKFIPYKLQCERQPKSPLDKPKTTSEFYKQNNYFQHFPRTMSIYH